MNFLILSPHFGKRHLVDSREEPFQDFVPSSWQTYFVQSALKVGHTVTTRRKPIADDDYDLGMIFLPTSYENYDFSDLNNNCKKTICRTNDANLHFDSTRIALSRINPDYVATRNVSLIDSFEDLGMRSFYFPFACFPDFMDAESNGQIEYDFFYSGKLGLIAENYEYRRQIANFVDSEYNARIHTYLAPLRTQVKFPPFKESLISHLIKNYLQKIPTIEFSNPPIIPRSYFEALSSARATFTYSTGAVDLRVFEAMCTGTPIYHEKSKEMRHLFEPGEAFIEFGSIEDFKSKSQKVVSDKAELAMTKKNAKQKIMKDHRYENRVERLENVLSGGVDSINKYAI